MNQDDADTRVLPQIAGFAIEGELGRGAMGVVYLAQDIRLGRKVAIKSLGEAHRDDSQFLGRFQREARLLATVSHPNIAAIHGFEEIDGRPYLILEYVPGETLAERLACGPLPLAQALDVCAQIAAALEAAHQRGVVHRDLKPANVKVTPDGRVKVLDFGLAKRVHDGHGSPHAPSIDLSRPGIVVGTVAYMSPEQMRGQEIDARSDVWALGCVLFECLSGRRAFSGNTIVDTSAAVLYDQPDWPALPGSTPARIDGLLHRALSKERSQRPASAAEFSAGFPGSAALRAAVAAGQTPTPDMVASAGGDGAVPARLAISMFAAVVCLLGLALWISPRVHIEGLDPLPKSPDVLVDRARTILKRMGHDGSALDSAHMFRVDPDFLNARAESSQPRERFGRAVPIIFWYRHSPISLAATDLDLTDDLGSVTPFEPPLAIPGMATVFLDDAGRLLEFAAIPEQRSGAGAESSEPDWSVAFAEAGLELQRFEACPPSSQPPITCDRRFAWRGTDPEESRSELRVEAGTLEDRPVYFSVAWPWTGERLRGVGLAAVDLAVPLSINFALSLFALAACAWLARRGFRRDEVDRRGARRLAAAVFLAHGIAWVFEADHVLVPVAELHMALVELGYATFAAASTWAAYVAIEPFVRRGRPWRIISWTRLLAGRIRDPLVGRDIMLGTGVGVLLACIHMASVLVPATGLLEDVAPFFCAESLITGQTRRAVSRTLIMATEQLSGGLLWFTVLFVAGVVLRREWLASVALAALVTWASLDLAPTDSEPNPVWITAPIVAAMVFVAQRLGVLSLCTGLFVFYYVKGIPPWCPESPWFSGITLLQAIVVLALAAFALKSMLVARA